MSHYTLQPLLTREGVVFTVKVDALEHECLISREALGTLSALKSIDAADADTMDLFHAFENTINGAARRLAAARTPGMLLLVSPDTFIGDSI